MNICTPETVGLSSPRLERIRPVMQAYVDQSKLAGVITAIARRGRLAHFECFGMLDIEAGKPMQPDTIFRIYSMTKPITCAAALMLYEEGHFQLSDPVSRFIPGFKDVEVYAGETVAGFEFEELEREVTVRDLLTHTSGLVYGNPEGSPVEVMLWHANREDVVASYDLSLQEWTQGLLALPLAFQPGSRWHYGVSHDVLGRVIEVVSGLSFDAFLEDRVFAPLGMVDTGFYVPSEKINRFAANYGPGEDGGLVVIDAPATGKFSKPRRFLSGGGGLVSTTADYLRFCQMLLNGGELEGVRLLGRKTVELMTMNHLPAELLAMDLPNVNQDGYGYGLGVAVLIDVAQSALLGSEGLYRWGGAASTNFWIDPKEELIGLVMRQFMPSHLYPIRQEFRVLAYQAIVG